MTKKKKISGQFTIGDKITTYYYTIGPARITQLIPQEFSGVTEVNLLRQLIP